MSSLVSRADGATIIAMRKAIQSGNAIVVLSPAAKAAKTARWARTMTKCMISLSRRAGVKWVLVEFGGLAGGESRGIVDIIAIRKNHKEVDGFKRGDLFDIVLIQTKGGSAARPSAEDIQRLRAVAKYHRAKAVVLAEWKKGSNPSLCRLDRTQWTPVQPLEIFG